MIPFLVWLVAAFTAGAHQTTTAQSNTPSYAYTAQLPSIVDGQLVLDVAFDPATNRLYAGSDAGLYWANLNEKKPRFHGPLFRRHITHLEMASDSGRLFYLGVEEVGYIDVRTADGPKVLAKNDMQAIDIAYEPMRQELYLSMRDPKLLVFDAKSGERGPSLELPGWLAYELEAVPGRVFFLLQDKTGLYSVDAATHQVGPWPITGEIVTPAQIEADPDGSHIFLAYYHQIVAIDVASATVTGREAIWQNGIAFDPGSGLLVALWMDPVEGTQRINAYRADADALTLATSTMERQLGGVAPFIEPTSKGFILRGNNRLYVWSLVPPPRAAR